AFYAARDLAMMSDPFSAILHCNRWILLTYPSSAHVIAHRPVQPGYGCSSSLPDEQVACLRDEKTRPRDQCAPGQGINLPQHERAVRCGSGGGDDCGVPLR